jgi:hypothetical protein
LRDKNLRRSKARFLGGQAKGCVSGPRGGRDWCAWICSKSPGSSPQHSRTHLAVFSCLGSCRTSNLVSRYMLWEQSLTHTDP